MTRTLTIAALAALAWLPPSTGAAAAQETTIEEAPEQLRLDPEGTRSWNRPHLPAERILRQLDPSACTYHAEDRVPLPGGGFKNTCRFDPAPRTAAELDAFADRVAAVAADATLLDDVRWEATAALAGAASADGDGNPYPRAFDLLVEVYEGGYDAALIRIKGDRFPERGPAYMRELFDRSERPPICPWGEMFVPLDYRPPPGCEDYSYWRDAHDTPWCKAGGYLFKKEVGEAWARTPGGKPRHDYSGPMRVPDGLPEEVEDWHRRCR